MHGTRALTLMVEYPLPLRGRHGQADWADADGGVSDSSDGGCDGDQCRGNADSHWAAHSHMSSHQ